MKLPFHPQILKLAATAFMLASTLPLFGENLLENGGFAHEMNTWSIAWRAKDLPAPRVVPNGHDGKPALEINGSTAITSAPIPLSSPILEVSGWIKWADVQTGKRRYHRASAVVQYFGKNGKIIGHKTAFAADGSGDWTFFNKQMVFPQAAATARLVLEGWKIPQGTIWFSDLAVKPVKEESAHVPDAAANLLTNPGFELEAGGASINWSFPTGKDWDGFPINPDAARNVHWDSTEKKSGNFALHLTGPATAVSEPIDVKPGIYSFKAFMKTAGVKTGAKRFCRASMQIVLFDDKGKMRSHVQSGSVEGDTGWTHYNSNVVVPPGVERVQVWLRLFETASGQVWFDNLSFVNTEVAKLEKVDRSQAAVTVDFKHPQGDFSYRADGIASSYTMEFARTPWKETILKIAAQRMGIYRVRFQEGCTMTQSRRLPSGKMEYDFSAVTALFHRIVGLGLTPLIVLESTPPALATHPKGKAFSNRYPPRDYAEWEDYIYRFVSCLRQEFGEKELARWEFETWNEPDAILYFKGSWDELLKVCDHTMAGARRAFPEIRVGTPGFTSGSRGALGRFLEHAGKEPGHGHLSFIAWHMYSTGRGIPSLLSIDHNLRNAAGAIQSHPWAAKLPRYITEWNSASGIGNDYLGKPYNAAYVLSAIRRIKDGGIDQLYVQVDCEPGSARLHGKSDEALFYNNRGMISRMGLIRPYTRALELLHRMQGEKIAAKSSNRPIEVLASANQEGRWITVWNYVEDPKEQFTTKVTLHLSGLPGSVPLKLEKRTLDERNDPFPRWKEFGKPDLAGNQELFDKFDRESGVDANLETVTITPRDGIATIELELPAFSIVSFRIPADGNGSAQAGR
ncbi:MAG TPA: hypothetical protein VNQ90_12330 [Chthoniobacteraceae bacterium]|nr:hypothetical protein [Chthoniobacteraceae bacterium]